MKAEKEDLINALQEDVDDIQRKSDKLIAVDVLPTYERGN